VTEHTHSKTGPRHHNMHF